MNLNILATTGSARRRWSMLHSSSDPWFIDGLWNQVDAILGKLRVYTNPRLRLFVVSYAGLFNHDNPKCND